MAPAAMVTTAAATAALIATYGKGLLMISGGLVTSGTAFWTMAGFRRIKRPACNKKIFLRDFMEHASTHTFQCPSCHDHVPFSELETHAQRHGFLCSVCTQTIPLRDFGAHLDAHREEDRESKDQAYQERVRALDNEYERRVRALDHEFDTVVRDIQRAQNEYNERREQFWGLKTKCPICQRDICIRDIDSHVALHGLELKPCSKRVKELANIKGSKGPMAKGFKVAALMKRWGGRQ